MDCRGPVGPRNDEGIHRAYRAITPHQQPGLNPLLALQQLGLIGWAVVVKKPLRCGGAAVGHAYGFYPARGAIADTHFSRALLPQFGQTGVLPARTRASKPWPQAWQR